MLTRGRCSGRGFRPVGLRRVCPGIVCSAPAASSAASRSACCRSLSTRERTPSESSGIVVGQALRLRREDAELELPASLHRLEVERAILALTLDARGCSRRPAHPFGGTRYGVSSGGWRARRCRSNHDPPSLSGTASIHLSGTSTASPSANSIKYSLLPMIASNSAACWEDSMDRIPTTSASASGLIEPGAPPRTRTVSPHVGSALSLI